MFEIGSNLRAAREHQQLALSEVERATRIRTKYLAALEDERFDVLPGTAYAKGFLRTYADFLGLDGPRFVDEFNERFAPAEEPEAAAPVRVERPRRWLDARLVVIPVAVGIGLLVWRLTSSGGTTHQHTVFSPTVQHVAVSTPTPAPPPTPQRPTKARIAFSASRGPCWLSVRLASAAGRILYDHTLRPGERASFVGTRLWIRLGAPWNVDATLNGKPAHLPVSVGDVLVTPGAVRSTGA